MCVYYNYQEKITSKLKCYIAVTAICSDSIAVDLEINF